MKVKKWPCHFFSFVADEDLRGQNAADTCTYDNCTSRKEKWQWSRCMLAVCACWHGYTKVTAYWRVVYLLVCIKLQTAAILEACCMLRSYHSSSAQCDTQYHHFYHVDLVEWKFLSYSFPFSPAYCVEWMWTSILVLQIYVKSSQRLFPYIYEKRRRQWHQ